MIVTISRQLASGGAYIGQRVAQQLGIRYVDREVLRQAAAALGVENEREVEILEERTSSVWAKVARALSIGPPDTPFVPPPAPGPDEADVLAAEIAIIREIAKKDDAVIVGRGAAHVLRGPTIIRVFVHAPEAHRIATVQTLYDLDEAAARQMVQRSDRNRSRFIQSLVSRPWTDACLYELALDTSVIPQDAAVDLIVRAVNARRQPPARASDAS